MDYILVHELKKKKPRSSERQRRTRTWGQCGTSCRATTPCPAGAWPCYEFLEILLEIWYLLQIRLSGNFREIWYLPQNRSAEMAEISGHR